MAKSKKRVISEGLVEQIEEAEKIVDSAIAKVRTDSANFNMIDDNLGHLFNHAQNIAGEFKVIKEQFQGFINREQAIADAAIAKAAADKAAAAAAAKAKADAAKAAEDDA